MLVTNRIFEMPAENPADPRHGSMGSDHLKQEESRKQAEALSSTNKDLYYSQFLKAARATSLKPQMKHRRLKRSPLKSQIQKFTDRRPSDQLIQACVIDLCDQDLDKEETLSVYESLASAKVGDRFIPLFQRMISANKQKNVGSRYTRPQLVESVVVPVSRIHYLNDQLLAKFIKDIIYAIDTEPTYDSVLNRHVAAVNDVAGYTPSDKMRKIYNGALEAVCATSPTSLCIAHQEPNVKDFFQSLAQFSSLDEVCNELDGQIQFTRDQLGSANEFTKEYLMPVISSYINFRRNLRELPEELRRVTEERYQALNQFTRLAGEPLHRLNSLFASINRNNITEEEFDIMDSLYQASVHQGSTQGLARLISWTGDSALELKRSYRDLVNRAMSIHGQAAQAMIGRFNNIFTRPVDRDPRYISNMIRCFNALMDSGNFNDNNTNTIGTHFMNLVLKDHLPSDLAFNKYISAIRRTSNDHRRLNRQLSLITAHDILMHNISDTGQIPNWNYFSKIFHNGDIPFRQGTNEYNRCAAESQGIMRASFNAHYGFGALANDAKGWHNSILARFGRDVALSPIQAPRCLDGNQFPGMGYVITGLNDEFLRIPDPSREMNGDEAYQDFISNYPFLASVADDIDSTQFILLRGMIVVTNLKDRYHLPDRDGNRIPYSLVVYNDHFHNNGYDIAFLVPSKLILDRIRPSLFYVYDSDAPDPPPTDINDISLDIKDLKEEANNSMNASIVNLGWSSNIAGLCNAWEPNHRPYHRWENRRGVRWRDLDGHKHKWFALSEPDLPWSQLTENEMRPFQNQHAEVYSVAKPLFDNLNSFKLFLSAYKHGYMGNFDQSTDYVSGDESKRVFANATGFEASSDNDIMLDQAYLLRQATINRGSENFPRLVVYDTYRWSSEPLEGFELDLADMTLTFDGTAHQLSLDSPTEADRQVWRDVFREFSGLDYDFRFYEEGLNQH